MNILYISSKKNWGGICSWMQKTALALEGRGHHCFIVAHPDGMFVKKADQTLSITSRKFGFDYNPIIILFFVKFIKKHKVDLVVANIEKEIIAGGIAAKLCGIPLLRRVGNEGDFKKRLKYKLHHKLLVDHTLTISKFTKQESLKKVDWVEAGKFSVIYHGRDFKNFNSYDVLKEKKKNGVGKSKFVLGVTGRLDKGKGIEDIIRAFKYLLADYPFLNLVITGEGKDEQGFKELASSLSVESSIFFTGFTKNPMLRAAIYDLALTYTYFEAIPNSLFEYLAVGCATISSRIGGIPELIEDGVNGLLVEAKSPIKLAERIALLIEDKEQRISLSKKAEQTMKNKFSEKIMIDNVEKLYIKLVEDFRRKL